MLICCGRHTSSQLENETVASASSVRTGDRSQLAEQCCSNMFDMAASSPVIQHVPLLASFAVCTLPSRPVPDRWTARLNWPVSCRQRQQKGSDPAEQTTALVLLHKVTRVCFTTFVLMRVVCPDLKITSDKIPKGRMASDGWCSSRGNVWPDLLLYIMYSLHQHDD